MTIFYIGLINFLVIIFLIFHIFFIKNIYDLFFSLFIIFFLLIFSFMLFFIGNDFFYEILIFIILFYFSVIFFIFNLNKIFYDYEEFEKKNKLTTNIKNICFSILIISLYVIFGYNFYLNSNITNNILIKDKEYKIDKCLSSDEHCMYMKNLFFLDKNIFFKKIIHILILYIFLIIMFYFYNKKNKEDLNE